MIDAVAARRGALEALDRISAGGVAGATFLGQLVDHVRTMLLVQACGPDSPAVRRLGNAGPGLLAHAKAAAPEKTLRICQVLVGSQQAMRHGVDPRLQLELACVRIAGLGQMVDADALLRRLERLESSGLAGAGAANPR